MRSLMMRRIAAGAVALLALSACASGEAGDPSPSVTVEDGGDLSPQVVRPELRIALAEKVVTQDADLVADFPSLQVLSLRSGTLFRLSADGSEILPYLASKGSFSDDRTSFVATLRSDIKFADGSPITAEDVVATFERSMKNEANINIGDFTPITSVTASGQDITFTFDRPYASFQALAATYEMAILKASEIAPDLSIPEVPTSSGQYSLSSGSVTGNSFALTRNPHSPLDLQPSVEKLSFSVVGDSAGRLAQLKGDQVDVALEIDPSAVQAIDPSLASVGSSTFLTYNMVMNNQAGITKDLKVRQAISLAIDRQRIADVAWGGLAKPNAEFFAATSRWSSGQGTVTADVERAKSLLAGTECANGCSLKLLATGGSDTDQRTAVIIQDSLKQIGIEVTIETLDTASINDRLFNLDFEASLNFVGSLVDEADLLTKYCFDYDYGLLSCFSGNANTSETEALVSATQLGQSDEALSAAADDVTEYFLETMPFVNLADYAITGVARADVAPYFSIGRTLQMQIAALKP